MKVEMWHLMHSSVGSAQSMTQFMPQCEGFDSIKDINDGNELWKFAVRLEDMWKMGICKGEHIEFLILDKQEIVEMIVRDVKGDTIHVTIGPDKFKKRKDEVASLMKLETHLIKNFLDLKNDATYKYIPDMPVSGFKFKKFEQIQAFEFREDLLYDLIGAVHEIGSSQTTAFAGKLYIPFTREGFGRNILDYIVFFLLVERYPLQISNAWTRTKLIINEDVLEIIYFKKSLPADNTYATQTQLLSSSSQSF
ncbi:hypothetical protein QL285_097178 [Trifolium repens]|nr:hypothetical protein QL285_097178 [Trifolium repens]